MLQFLPSLQDLRFHDVDIIEAVLQLLNAPSGSCPPDTIKFQVVWEIVRARSRSTGPELLISPGHEWRNLPYS